MGSEMLVFLVFHTSHYFVVHAAILIFINKLYYLEIYEI